MSNLKKYGSKKKRNRTRVTEFVCVEPTRRSLYDVLLDNMQLVQRNTFVHRIIYIGSHTFPSTEVVSIAKYFRKNIDYVNSKYNEEYLSGFLLHYTGQFMHVLDVVMVFHKLKPEFYEFYCRYPMLTLFFKGSEDSIKKHLDLLFLNEETAENLETVKVLVVYHNINQRFMTNWMEMKGKPPNLLERIKSDTDAHEAGTRIMSCISKLYNLGIMLKGTEDECSLLSTAQQPPITESTALPHIAPTRKSNVMDTIPVENLRRSTVQTAQSEYKLGNKLSMARFTQLLPEQQLIDFLLETPHTLDIHDYMNFYGSVPMLYAYPDICWPVMTDFIPRNVFDEEYDPVIEVFEPSVSVQLDPELIQV